VEMAESQISFQQREQQSFFKKILFLIITGVFATFLGVCIGLIASQPLGSMPFLTEIVVF